MTATVHVDHEIIHVDRGEKQLTFGSHLNNLKTPVVVTLKSPIEEAKMSSNRRNNLNGQSGRTAGLHETVPIPWNQWLQANGSWILLVEGLVAVANVNEELLPSSSAIPMVKLNRSSLTM